MKNHGLLLRAIFIVCTVMLFACGGSSSDGEKDTNPLDGGNGGSGSYSISGKVVDSSGSGIGGVTISLTSDDVQSTATTDQNGDYSFTGMPNGSYMVIPSMTGYTFSPDFRTVVINEGNATIDTFTSQSGGNGGGGETDTIIVTISEDDPPIISWTGGQINSLIVMSVRAVMSNYTWSITSPQTQMNAISSPVTYGVLPENAVEEVSNDLEPGEEYRVTVARTTTEGNVIGYGYFTAPGDGSGGNTGYKVTGAVVDGDRRSISNATVVLLSTNATTVLQTTTSDSDGMYEFTGVMDGMYYVSVSHDSYEFRLPMQQIVVNGSHKVVSNFVGDEI